MKTSIIISTEFTPTQILNALQLLGHEVTPEATTVVETTAPVAVEPPAVETPPPPAEPPAAEQPKTQRQRRGGGRRKNDDGLEKHFWSIKDGEAIKLGACKPDWAKGKEIPVAVVEETDKQYRLGFISANGETAYHCQRDAKYPYKPWFIDKGDLTDEMPADVENAQMLKALYSDD